VTAVFLLICRRCNYY